MKPGSETSDPAAGWQHFPHVADMGVRGYGGTVAEAFAQTALALTAVICEPDRVLPAQSVSLHCDAPDLELLLVDWLNALIYQMAVRQMLFSRFQVRIENHTLQATAWGEPIDRERHRPAVEIKGATYTALQVEQEASGRWYAQCVVDV